ncbi:DUF547 domain-containing protein [Marinigracilibium pacificum]|uniref:DUF547 domain-containing protein n=1 Tax=Marinigracilibium pacificum TaxID=2729599 RepID=A0A848J0B1_9BACT|nr:DUF547 domain-containing protein [Marinigracilibium pacificum]NMM49987.1 DUF547 domain-containing protein [Marinigracilibium pacificum]
MRYLFIIFVSLISLASCNGQTFEFAQNTTPPDHSPFSTLLKKYVDDQGMVDYKGLRENKNILDNYLETLSNNPPSQNWSDNEQLAYWINAYNGFTLKLIVDNYPVKSIKDLHPTIMIPLVKTVWHRKFFKINGVDFNLDEIEHGILRKQFKEPRIHFAINCASFSCPPLRNEAFTAEKLDSQLQEQAIWFINDSKRNIIKDDGEVYISKIFSWFKGDFTKEISLIEYLNQYSYTKINSDASINYMEYDWNLNEQ